MNENIAKQILKTIPDPKLRMEIGNILNGTAIKMVRCMSEKCKGRVVAYILKDGRVQPSTEHGKMYLRAYRTRLDGYLGFQCWCGNDSRLSLAEKGNKNIENNNTVTKEDILNIWNKLQKKKPNYPVNDGKQIVDNFLIEDINHGL